jgi:hypothetical protein
MRRPAFWIGLALAAAAATAVGVRYFPQAFSIVALDITMDRAHALEEARRIAARDALGPAGFRQAASFGGNDEAQTFIELEGGGKDAFTRTLRDRVYDAFMWRVRHFKEGETNETAIHFAPDGRPVGFEEKLKEDAPGAALDARAARAIAETGAARWNVDLARFGLVEQGQERRPGGRVDHTFTYERGDVTFNEGRVRLRLAVSGDKLTAVTTFVKIPEAFTRRYASMRSANDLIGVGSAVGLILLYVIGGIGVGLFFMMRRRWVLWRTAAIWGIVVGGLQSLAMINELPLAWMLYDTALPRSTFLAQQIALMAASFAGFSVFFALSFMAAETLTRRAFGRHPQLWRAWGRDQGASIQILGRTVGGYLLVSIFFAYDVLLYLVMTKVFGWWSPAEALVHPDVLATYVPWLSAIANSFQAGFWEESMFRAVPLAGAALIGDRFGKRNLFLVIGFVVQAIVFGAGHAAYPNQPAYARPVELIIPSIGFGLLYLYWGLLPGIILHFAFDVVWFALPIFLAKAPGIWFQQVMVAALTLVPLWIVLWRRARAGRWTELSPDDYNAAWQPPPARERAAEPQAIALPSLDRASANVWLTIGAVALVAIAMTAVRGRGNPFGGLPITRAQAEVAARQELQRRGVALGPKWRVMPVPDDGSGGPHQYVYETAGETRWRELLGVYLPKPRWRVRVATFEGDVADRAEEWRITIGSDGAVRGVQHVLPEGRAGASLEEAAARQLAVAAVNSRYTLDAAQLKDVSARPAKQKARTDWTFTFLDTTVAPLGPPAPQGEGARGEPWIEVTVAGDEVTSVGRFIHVPEDWERRQRAGSTRNVIIQISTAVVLGGLLLAAAITGMVCWSRGRYTPRAFLAAAAIMLAVSIAGLFNSWPSVIAALPTAAPLQLQIIGVVAIGAIGLTIVAAMVGLAIGALPTRLASMGRLPDRDALRLGVAAGLAMAGAAAVASAIRAAPWARVPPIDALGTFVPIADAAFDPIAGVMTRIAVVTAALVAIDGWTASWTRRRTVAAIALAIVGFLSGGPPVSSHLGTWAIAGALSAAALVAAYITLLRFDLTMVPVGLGVMAAVGALMRMTAQPYPGASAGSILAAAFVTVLAAGWFRALRRGARTADAPAV